MGFKCGIVGLPNVGKSTLFNALTASKNAEAANFPFCTIDPNIGVVDVIDQRLDKLAELSKSKKKIYTNITFVDIAGLVKGASKGEGLGNKFLSHIREVDAMFTREKGLALGVVTADCVPILIYEKTNQIVGCIHAGWKGAFSGIIKNTISKIRKLNSKNIIYASIGPCIGKFSYEVDLSFFRKFIKQSKMNKKYFSKKNKKKKIFHLRKFVADQLIALGVTVDHVNYDTFTRKDIFFSYRRSSILKQRDYGRCISTISLI